MPLYALVEVQVRTLGGRPDVLTVRLFDSEKDAIEEMEARLRRYGDTLRLSRTKAQSRSVTLEIVPTDRGRSILSMRE